MRQTETIPGDSHKNTAVPPVKADISLGLSSEQVRIRQEAGLSNVTPASNTKSERQIIKENTFTFFNLIFIVLAAALILVASFKNLTFLCVAIANTVIGIFQEIRAKRAVDELTLVAAASIPVIRDGTRFMLRSVHLVRAALVEFSSGAQICADAVVRSGELFANESLLTGEADAILKKAGDTLKSGSFVISGRCLAQLTHVGAESYAAKLAAEARRDVRSTKSEMMTALSRLITVVGIALVPMGIFLFLRHHLDSFQGMDLTSSVEATVAALIGMIPEGLYLLTSIAIAASCLKLSKQRVLVQDMNCIETLAHVDILCVDKTGTITQPRMEVDDILPLSKDYSYDQVEEILASYYYNEQPDNETADAMSSQFAHETGWIAKKRIPFSSATKWSAADFGEHGKYLIGAPEFILGSRFEEIRSKAEPMSAKGCRVLLLASYHRDFSGSLDPAAITPIALVFLNNLLRPDAKETFQYFAKQGVSVRVISGDNPLTVSEIAKRAGILNADRYIDATKLVEDRDFEEAVSRYTVFGRVTPDQKRKLVRAFQGKGHTVAMTGDGVNDVLALKDANCGIAMASGSQAASQVSQIVLLDSQFSAMPQIVAEGRRVINNIQRSASLFLVKNIFSFALTLILLFVNMTYPLQAIQLSLISCVTIGIPAFFLALEPNYSRVEGRFLRNVIIKALPGGLTDLIMLLLAGLCASAFRIKDNELNTISVILVTIVGFITLYRVCVPFTKLRIAVFASMLAATIISFLFFPGFLELSPLRWKGILILILLVLFCPAVMEFFHKVVQWSKKSKKST